MKNYINKPDILKWYIYKILLIMRLTAVILMISMLQASASTVAQEFNYVKKGVSLIQIFKEIKKQTGYNIIWNEKKIDVTKTIDVNFKNATIHDVLNKSLSNLPLTYSIDDKMVMIKEDKFSFREKLADFFSSIDVKGKVVDENNLPLVGATVKVKNSTKSTLTDNKGFFTLNDIEEASVLVISYIGYQSKEIIASANLMSISLVFVTDKLQEVEINAGYFKVKDRERTGSISRITSKDIEKQPVNNVLQAMQATIPGVEVTQSSGVPGSGFKVQIRGRNSIQQGNNPFYIIDGVPFSATPIAPAPAIVRATPEPSPLASINPNDIESIEVLKDADATAIYGSRGANGVILITTKKGRAEKTTANVSITQGVSRVGKKLDLMNTSQYLEMRNEAFANDKLSPPSNQNDVNGIWRANQDTDWQKFLIGGTAKVTNVQTSLSGVAENITYLIGGAYHNEGTVFPGENSFSRSSGNFNVQYHSKNRKFLAQLFANYSQTNSDLFPVDLTSYIFLLPNYPAALNSEGLLNWENNTMYVNPLAITKRLFVAKTKNLISNVTLNYSIAPSLQIKTNVGYTTMDRRDYSNQPLSSISPASASFNSVNRIANFSDNAITTWIIEPQINWDKRFTKSKLSFLAGLTCQNNLTDGQTIVGNGYTSDALLGNIASASLLSTFSREYLNYRYIAVFSRLNFNLSEKYFLNITARRDGSSRFGTERRFANFGAIGAAWIVSEEKLIREKLPFISFAKIRSSYGISGNDQISDYGYLELWTSNASLMSTYQGTSTILPSQLSNKDYAWENNRKTEVALDLGFFKNRVNVSFAYYRNISSNQLIGKQLPPSTGFRGINDNLPAKVSNTGWEFVLTSKNVSGNQFTWTTAANITIPKNKLVSYPGLTTSGDADNYEVGLPLSILKAYNTYLDAQTGLYVVEDYDQNGIINNNDRYKREFVGRSFYGGIQNILSYKRFQLDFLLQFVKQRGKSFYNNGANPGRFSVFSPFTNAPIQALNRWQKEGDLAVFQKYSTSTAAFLSYNNAINFGSLAIEDQSFLRLKNVSVYYDLPSRLIQKVKMGGGKVFLQAQNLITITNFKGLDPEIQGNGILPSLQVITAGLQVKF